MTMYVICPYLLGPYYLQYYRREQPFLDVKIVPKKQLKDLVFGRFSDDALLTIVKTLHCSFDDAKSAMDFLLYCEHENHGHTKLNRLYHLRKKLLAEGKLIVDDMAKKRLAQQKAIIHHYDQNDQELLTLLKALEIDYYFAPTVVPQLPLAKVVKYQTIDDELNGLFNAIADLLNHGTASTDILIYGISDEHRLLLHRFVAEYGVCLNLRHDRPLFTSPLIKDFFMMLEQTKDCKQAYVSVFEQASEQQYRELAAIRDVFNALYDDTFSLDEQKKLLADGWRATMFEDLVFESGIQVIDQPIFVPNKHLFVVSCAREMFPIIAMDDDELEDAEKQIIGAPTSKEVNYLRSQEIKQLLQKNDYIHLSYHEFGIKQKHDPSPLFGEYHLTIVDHVLQKTSYARTEVALSYARLLDYQRKYRFVSDELLIYRNSLSINYLSYDHRYKVFALENVPQTTYSYTRMAAFFACQFRYYLKHYLDIDDFEESFNTKIGSVMHGVLEDLDEPNFSFESSFNKHVERYEFDVRELVLLKSVKEHFAQTIAFVKEIEALPAVQDIAREKQLIVHLSPEVSVKGKLDKILTFKANNRHYLSVIDYKTSGESEPLKEVYIKYGLSLQLPTYAMLLSESLAYKHHDIFGLYINPLIPTSFKAPGHDDVNFRQLRGFTLDDLNVFKSFEGVTTDGSYKSPYLKGISITSKNTFSERGGNRLTAQRLQTIVDMTKTLYLEGNRKIKAADFRINPKINNQMESCRYCDFLDICGRKYDDFIYIEDEVEDEQDEMVD